MSRYIDADVKPVNPLEDLRPKWISVEERLLENGENEYVYDTNAVLDSIDSQPTVDAVEVVRCKECLKCLVDNSKREFHLCMKRQSFPVRVKLDGFCSYGERKEGADNA